MFGFGGLGEIAFIFFLAMLIFGPEKLPEIGRLLAKGMAEVRKASNELKRTLNAELAISEQEAEARRLAALTPAVPPAPLAPSSPAGTLGPIVPAGPVALSTEPPLFPPLHTAADPVDTGAAAEDPGQPVAAALPAIPALPALPATPTLRAAQGTVPSLPPGHRAPAAAESGAGGAETEPEGTAGKVEAAAVGSGEAAPLAPYGQGRDPRGERADADVN
jgi:Sec-independent protein translocase protein TatA